MTIDHAFVLAAGLGSRLRPYTDDRPKPLVAVAGQSLLDRTLDHLAAAGVTKTIINTHYRADQIERAVRGRFKPEIILSNEPDLLDTGGGINNALTHFGGVDGAPFFVLSGDGLWRDAPDAPALPQLAAAWDPENMDILMLLQPIETIKLTQGAGDYDLMQDGRALRRADKSGAYMFTSMRINHPRIFKDAPPGAFSYLALMDAAQQAGRLYGIMHKGDWHHISTPDDLGAVRAVFGEDA